jgi:hypothetical protein
MYHNFVNYPWGMSWFAWTFGWSLIILLAIWEMVWKATAMWHAARNNQSGWFVALLVFNTIGILPILYIYVFSPKDKR